MRPSVSRRGGVGCLFECLWRATFRKSSVRLEGGSRTLYLVTPTHVSFLLTPPRAHRFSFSLRVSRGRRGEYLSRKAGRELERVGEYEVVR